MADKAKRLATKRIVEQSLRHWLVLLGLDKWHVEVQWDVKNKVHAFAQNFVATEYQDMQISFNLDKLADMSSKFIEETVVHELLHAVVGQLPQLPKNTPARLVSWFEENAVTNLAAAFMRVSALCKDAKNA